MMRHNNAGSHIVFVKTFNTSRQRKKLILKVTVNAIEVGKNIIYIYMYIYLNISIHIVVCDSLSLERQFL